MHNWTEMLDVVVEKGQARGVIIRDLRSGKISRLAADAVVLASGGYANVFYLSTNAKKCNVTATYRAFKRGAGFANPCYTQIHPTCIPQSGEHQSKLTLMSESLRNDGRVWVPKEKGDRRPANSILEEERDYYLERIYPTFGNLVPRDVASRAAKRVCDEGRGIGPTKYGVYLDFASAIKRLGEDTIRDRYGNLFEMYERITGENPYKVPMRIYPASHYTMGGLWVDYNLMSTIKGMFVVGEANFSDHGANRLGASALMQGLADGYFVLPYTIGNYLRRVKAGFSKTEDACFAKTEEEVTRKITRLLAVKGDKPADHFHRKLGEIIWDYCGMSRSKEGLKTALEEIPELRKAFWEEVSVPGSADSFNPPLEYAGRVADFLEFGEIMVRDALEREESCGAHFRQEYSTEDSEAKRNDEDYSHVTVWEYAGDDRAPRCHLEHLEFSYILPSQRSYK